MALLITIAPSAGEPLSPPLLRWERPHALPSWHQMRARLTRRVAES